MDGGDPRTPMAWQHRDHHMPGPGARGPAREARADRQSPSRNGGYSYREGPAGHGGTPGSRRAKSQERGGAYSRSQSREREAGPGRGRHYRSQPSPSTTEGTAEDTTETDTVEREGSEYQQQM
jgi:hypothetical protein